MGNKLKRIFNPTPEEAAEDFERYVKLYKELAKEKGCSTCGNIKHVIDYPGFVTAEENECMAGLKCDTVLFKVKNCPCWVDGFKEGDAE